MLQKLVIQFRCEVFKSIACLSFHFFIDCFDFSFGFFDDFFDLRSRFFLYGSDLLFDFFCSCIDNRLSFC
ncbi:MAG: hypothetical protein ACN4GF_04965 [Lentimonas sp.]